MHLMSCEHPIRVYNKYINEYIWTPCGKCNTCKNRRAKRWTDACERERSVSSFTMFVTLTYDEFSLPCYTVTGGFDSADDLQSFSHLHSTRLHDVSCMAVTKELFDTPADKELFDYYLENKGIPYASRTDIQLFHKRLNKWFHDNVTHKYKNFRYFYVSELGTTTLRPHFHALYFINDYEVARRFQDGILSCWKFGRIDCQYVENSACSYVAQYINKSSDLPSFYKADEIRPFFGFSRCPTIGNVSQPTQSDEEIFNNCLVQKVDSRGKSAELVLSELDTVTENRIFPKCTYFSQISYSLRIELYAVSSRFSSRTFQEFREKIRKHLSMIYDSILPAVCSIPALPSPFTDFLHNYCDGFSKSGVEWLKRVYYLSRKVCRNAERFGVSIFAYVRKIEEYYSKKELHLINKMYQFEQDYMSDSRNSVEDLALIYPEYLWQHGYTIGDYLSNYTPADVLSQRLDAAHFAYSNKMSHFKNVYLDSLKEKNNRFYLQLKNFYHAKKCNEITEALAT